VNNRAYPSEKASTFNGTDICSPGIQLRFRSFSCFVCFERCLQQLISQETAGHSHEPNRRLFFPNCKELLADRATVESVKRSVSTLVSHSVKLVRIRHPYPDNFSPAADDDVERAFDRCYYQLRDFSLPFYNDSDYQESSFKEPFLHKFVLRLGNKTKLHLLLADKTSRRFVVEALVASALELWIFEVHQHKRTMVFKEATESVRRTCKMRKIQGLD
jgi:predicted DNA-binding protein with PD1-like motif